MNIVEPILFQARYQPEAPALCAPGIDTVSYARLCTQMNNVARRARAYGLERGSVVALSIDQPLLHSVIILGLSQAGIVPVSVAMHRPPAGLRIDAVISNTGYPFAPQARRLPLDHSWIAGDGAAFETEPHGGSASDEVCLIVLTSGSTGDPKAVALTHRLVMARNARFDYLFGSRFPTLSRIYMHVGLAASFGHFFLVHVLGRGGTVFLRGDGPDNTLRSFKIFQIQAIVATPGTLAQLLALCDQHPTIGVQVDTVLSGGGVVSRTLLERARPRLCSHLVVHYGSTESGTAAMAPAHRISSIEGAAGYVTPGARIEIVDENDCPVAAGTEGIVRVASEFAVDHYVDDPIGSAQVFRDGWFYPGDVGSLTSDNLLILSGRRNNVLNAGGGKMTAEKIEAALLSFKGVSEAAVLMMTNKLGVEEVWAAIVCREQVDTERLRSHCLPRMPVVFVPAHIVTLDALPINDLGKTDRPRLRQMLMTAATPASGS